MSKSKITQPKKQQKNSNLGGNKPQWPGQNASKNPSNNMNQNQGKTQSTGSKDKR